MQVILLVVALLFLGFVSASDLTLPTRFCSESNSTEAVNISLGTVGQYGYLVSHRGYDFNLVSLLGNEAPLFKKVPLACKWRFVAETGDDLQLAIRFVGVQQKRSKHCSKTKGSFLGLVLRDHGNQSLATEFCGSSRFDGETSYRLQNGASLVIDVRMAAAFRGFSFFYHAKKFPQHQPSPSLANAIEPADHFVADKSGPLVSVLARADNSSTDLEATCRTSNGTRLTELSGKLRVQKPSKFSESFQCKWELRPALEENRQIKFMKFRVTAIDNATYPSCSDFGLEISFNDKSNVTHSLDLCQNGAVWQTVETLTGIDFVFKSLKNGLDNSTAAFDSDFYTITTSQFPEKPPTDVECGRSALQSAPARVKRVVGGQPAPSENWPWLVVMFLENNKSVVCTANIINERWLLSTAKCFQPNTLNSLVSWDFANNLEIENIFPHSLYHNKSRVSKDHDISLIKLKKAIPFESSGLSPICLPSVELNNSQLCYVAGRGDTKGTGENGQLYEARIPVMANDECHQMSVLYKRLVTDKMICAGYKAGGIDTCTGDTGGPLACNVDGRWELHGLTSWGKGCADRNAPGVYTKVASYLEWIRQVIEYYS